jgi:hypothetical protein
MLINLNLGRVYYKSIVFVFGWAYAPANLDDDLVVLAFGPRILLERKCRPRFGIGPKQLSHARSVAYVRYFHRWNS